jgi:Calcineurin-like phosphoesterase
MFWQITGAIGIAILAILATVDFQRLSPVSSQSESEPSRNDSPKTTYVIGDLHGDVQCAKHWVKRIGVVDDVQNPRKWLKKNATLVFMGDYIDKGPFSYQTILFVKSLADRFHDKVTTLMGNHELEVLLDRHPERWPKFYHYSYAVIHPMEFRNFIFHRKLDKDDELVIDLLMNASIAVYAKQMEQEVPFVPESDSHSTIVDFVQPQHHKSLVQQRLVEYQNSYISAFYSNTSLGQWVQNLKVIHEENGALFVHGGINKESAMILQDFDNLDDFNRVVAENHGEDKFHEFIETTKIGSAIATMLYYRGNHKTGSCDELNDILKTRKGDIQRLVVGHTPGTSVRKSCNGQFIAADSLLGRWIRTSGNYYCPTEEREINRFKCPKLEERCRGQVLQINAEGSISVIEAN